jgi:hypothetical protein
MRTINTTLVEEVYHETFEELKNNLKETIFREVNKYVEEKSIEDFFAQLYTDEDVIEFINQNDFKKVEDILSWFKGELWTLNGPVSDFTRDEFDFETPNQSFEIETRGVSNHRFQFNYLIPSPK